jgi:hypothetical protein
MFWKNRLAALGLLIIGLLSIVWGPPASWTASFFIVILGCIAVWRTTHTRSSNQQEGPPTNEYEWKPFHDPTPPNPEQTAVPTQYTYPPRGTRCIDCSSELKDTDDAFYFLVESNQLFVCIRCRDLRIARKRSAKQ